MDFLLRLLAQLGLSDDDRRVVAGAAGVSEGDSVEHAVRGTWAGLRQRATHGRYFPPIGGFLYFLRPGTTKLPLVRGLPLLGGIRRTWLDVGLYVALVGLLLRALVASELTAEYFVPIVVLVPIIGVADRTIFLALRSEHYWTTTVCFVLAGDWIAGAKAVQLALWFWAGFSKLNHHFPSVVCVMMSNSPVMRLKWLRKRMYRDFPATCGRRCWRSRWDTPARASSWPCRWCLGCRTAAGRSRWGSC